MKKLLIKKPPVAKGKDKFVMRLNQVNQIKLAWISVVSGSPVKGQIDPKGPFWPTKIELNFCPKSLLTLNKPPRPAILTDTAVV